MELSGYGIGKTLEGDAFRNAIDYRLYSCNHYHLDFGSRRKKGLPAAMLGTRLRMSPLL